MIPLLVFLAAARAAVLCARRDGVQAAHAPAAAARGRARDESGALAAYLDDPLEVLRPGAADARRAARPPRWCCSPVRSDRGCPGGIDPLRERRRHLASASARSLPALIVRRSPERLLELLLPAFTAVANVVGPFTALIIGVARTDRAPRRPRTVAARRRAGGRRIGRDRRRPQAEQSRLLRSVVDFGETLVREVMTPRPDIVAIRADATIDDLRQLVREQEYSRLPVYTDNLDNIVGLIVVKDLIQMTRAPDGDAQGRRHHAARVVRAGDQARGGPAAGVPAEARSSSRSSSTNTAARPAS